MNEEISSKRKQKADELTAELGQHIRVEIDTSANTDTYLKRLENLLASIGADGGRIHNKDAQLRAVIKRIDPLTLAQALERRGIVSQDDGSETTLPERCCITPNTASVLCSIARDMRMLNELATVETPDVPRILVRRRGESFFADLRTGLSPGEQSAAILTLALETRSAPLLLDQPEDELGYSYVVHLIVPKILKAKFSRQMVVVTHNANIAVLGDADLVVKMENQPQPDGARCCIAAATGSFESHDVTAALLELEGGLQAFQYRQHRYSLKNGAELRSRENAAGRI